MIQDNLNEIYKKFRIELYRHIFSVLGEREGSLTAADYFSVESIYIMGTPTISEFAKMLSISLPNATYRVKSLVEKGYIEKIGSDKKSASRLKITEKFLKYYHDDLSYANVMLKMFADSLDEVEIAEVNKVLEKIVKPWKWRK